MKFLLLFLNNRAISPGHVHVNICIWHIECMDYLYIYIYIFFMTGVRADDICLPHLIS